MSDQPPCGGEGVFKDCADRHRRLDEKTIAVLVDKLQNHIDNTTEWRKDHTQKVNSILNCLNGDGLDKLGLVPAVHELKQSEKRREGHIRMLWGAVIALGVEALHKLLNP